MPDELLDLDGVRVLVSGDERGRLGNAQDALDLIGEAGRVGAAWVAVPLEQLGDQFLDLSSGVAGDVVQRFVLYGLKLAIVGDVEEATARSGSLRAFVAEANRGTAFRFVPSVEALRPA